MVEAISGGPHPGSGDLVRRMYSRYWEAFYERMQPQADALKVLAALKASGPLVLVSNHTALPQLGKLAALGFDGMFDAAVTSEEAGVEKPAARIFEVALDRAGTGREEAVMIGDDPGDRHRRGRGPRHAHHPDAGVHLEGGLSPG